MLKVLLVDDEPFIVQGLSALIDWEKEGFEIVGTSYRMFLYRIPEICCPYQKNALQRVQ